MRSDKIAPENFLSKVIDGLLKLTYTDKCRWQAFPPSRKPSDASLSFADPAAGLFSSGPAVSAGRRGFHTPLSTLVGHFPLLELPVIHLLLEQLECAALCISMVCCRPVVLWGHV